VLFSVLFLFGVFAFYDRLPNYAGEDRSLADRLQPPSLDSASPSEQKLPKRTIAAIRVRRTHRPGRPRSKPERLILDRGYDSNLLRARLARRGIEPIIPAQKNHPNATYKDGRKLRRYRRRGIVERTFAWFGLDSAGSWCVTSDS
jgi:hypothetical protein